jgi:hypothetical protein
MRTHWIIGGALALMGMNAGMSAVAQTGSTMDRTTGTQPGPTIALVAAVGDQMTIVRQEQSVGTHMQPYKRKTLPVNGQVLNLSVLRGLDQALAAEEPDSRRVFLRWNTPAAVQTAMESAHGRDRDELLLTALREHVRALPERAQWSRIEAIVPHFVGSAWNGMGTKLSGMGIFIQPLPRGGVDINEDGDIREWDDAVDGHTEVIDPKTGLKTRRSTFVAPYFYFDRVTLDAQTLDILARKPQFENTKYHDPDSQAGSVGKQMSMGQAMAHLSDLVERAAYKSIRGNSTVETSPVRAAPASRSASGASGASGVQP